MLTWKNQSYIIIEYYSISKKSTFMDSLHQQPNTPRNSRSPYRRVSYTARKDLIKLVAQQGFSVYRACRLLNINNSTAKAIIRKFRVEGTIFLRKSEKKVHRQPVAEDGTPSFEENEPESPQQRPELNVQRQCSPIAASLPSIGFYIMGLPIYFIPYS